MRSRSATSLVLFATLVMGCDAEDASSTDDVRNPGGKGDHIAQDAQSVVWNYHDNVEGANTEDDILVSGTITLNLLGDLLPVQKTHDLETGRPLQELEMVLEAPAFGDPETLTTHTYLLRLQQFELEGKTILRQGNGFDPTVVINTSIPDATETFEDTYDEETQKGRAFHHYGEGMDGFFTLEQSDDGTWRAVDPFSLRFFPDLGTDFVIRVVSEQETEE